MPIMPDTAELSIKGVRLFTLNSFMDDRGAFTELFRTDWANTSMPAMVQANLSRSRADVVRGLHFHRNQADYWMVVHGSIRVGMFDLRVGSPTEGKGCSVLMEDWTPSSLYIPPGVAHGYQTLRDTSLVYLVDLLYDGTDEYGLKWDDPALGLSWSEQKDPILSERDKNNPSLDRIPKENRPRYTPDL